MGNLLSQLATIVIATLMLAAALPAAAFAAAEREENTDFIGRVVVSPIMFIDERETDALREARAAARSGIESYVANLPTYFELVSRTELESNIKSRPTYADSVAIGQSWAEIGTEHYKRLETNDAIKALEKAVTIYQSIHYEYVEPERFAEVLQTLALSYMDERRDLVRPLELLQLMMQLAPARVFRQGYFAEEIVRTYDGARQTLQRDLQDNGPHRGLARKITELAQADYVFVLTATRKDAGFEVALHPYARKEGRFLVAERIQVPIITPAILEEASNRLVSRVTTCLIQPPAPAAAPVQASTGDSPWAMELNFAYATFLAFPVAAVDPFGNAGASFGVSFLFTREFAVVASAQVLNSVRDKSGFITDDFTTLRALGGVSLGYDFGPVRTEIASLLEVTTVGDIEVCEDISSIISGCADDSEVYSFDALVGINARPRVTLRLLKSLELAMGGSATFFFFPLSERLLNFPITVESGLQYRF